jgi:hypothetical protein
MACSGVEGHPRLREAQGGNPSPHLRTSRQACPLERMRPKKATGRSVCPGPRLSRIGFSPIEPRPRRGLQRSPRTCPPCFPTRCHGARPAAPLPSPRAHRPGAVDGCVWSKAVGSLPWPPPVGGLRGPGVPTTSTPPWAGGDGMGSVGPWPRSADATRCLGIDGHQDGAGAVWWGPRSNERRGSPPPWGLTQSLVG